MIEFHAVIATNLSWRRFLATNSRRRKPRLFAVSNVARFRVAKTNAPLPSGAKSAFQTYAASTLILAMNVVSLCAAAVTKLRSVRDHVVGIFVNAVALYWSVTIAISHFVRDAKI